MDNIFYHIFDMKVDDIIDALKAEDSHNIRILSERTLREDLESDHCYYVVAKDTSDNDKVIAYAGLSYVLDEADIISIVVHKDYTNKGIAFTMLDILIAYCISNHFRTITLEVRESNAVAQRLYEKMGFKKISVRKNYYDGKEDAIIMQLCLR